MTPDVSLDDMHEAVQQEAAFRAFQSEVFFHESEDVNGPNSLHVINQKKVLEKILKHLTKPNDFPKLVEISRTAKKTFEHVKGTLISF